MADCVARAIEAGNEGEPSFPSLKSLEIREGTTQPPDHPNALTLLASPIILPCALPSLTYLSLSGVKDEPGSTALIRALQNSAVLPQLADLHLHETGLKGDGAMALAGMLETRENLKSLHLPSNPIGAEAVEALARAGMHLTNLSLSCGTLEWGSVGALAKAMREPGVLGNLESLDVSMTRGLWCDELVSAIKEGACPKLWTMEVRGAWRELERGLETLLKPRRPQKSAGGDDDDPSPAAEVGDDDDVSLGERHINQRQSSYVSKGRSTESAVIELPANQSSATVVRVKGASRLKSSCCACTVG
jgi:hypothetical protein